MIFPSAFRVEKVEFKNTNGKIYTKRAELKDGIEQILENAELKITNWGKFAFFYSGFFSSLKVAYSSESVSESAFQKL